VCWRESRPGQARGLRPRALDSTSYSTAWFSYIPSPTASVFPEPRQAGHRGCRSSKSCRPRPPRTAVGLLERGTSGCTDRIIAPVCDSKQEIAGKWQSSRALQGCGSGRTNTCAVASLDWIGPRPTLKAAFQRSWRNWQTHQLEGLAPARAWRFKPSRPHFASSPVRDSERF
jgi:hypothetical protein